MSEAVIKVENLGKQYRLGKVGTGTLSHDLNRWWAKIRGKEDPYLKIGSENRRDEKGDSDYVWALRDINFEVKRGEVLGIIGKNGAGKSTLLKILSRVTTPTLGEIKVKGRISSLLEVGTGFHPELSGRENIFLNGAILGMTKQEIRDKYDEIVDFAGVERYIDTPVKRYSSGMYVRLAFGVAAHLEPEILIVDEVLAVGDAEFQKKCLGKMEDVSRAGRTVLFVSHNMPAVRQLCTRGILLINGEKNFDGSTEEAISRYSESNKVFNLTNRKGIVYNDNRRNTDHLKLTNIYLTNVKNEKTYNFKMGETIRFCFEFEVMEKVDKLVIYIGLKFLQTNNLITTLKHVVFDEPLTEGKNGTFSVDILNNNFRPGEYPLVFQLSDELIGAKKYDVVDDLTPRLVISLNGNKEITDFNPFIPIGCVNVDHSVSYKKIN